MHRPQLAGLALLLSLALAPSGAHAQASRAGRVMGLGADRVAVWIDATHAWVPGALNGALSACIATRCLPIEARETCIAPRCPGNGTIYQVAQPLASVGGWPTDYGGFEQSRTWLSEDTALASIHNQLQHHPEHGGRQDAIHAAEHANRDERRRHEESVRWVSQHRAGDRVELSLHGTVASLSESHGTFVGGVLGLAYVAHLRHSDADEDDEDDVLLNALLGDTFGAELRVHYLHRLDSSVGSNHLAPNAPSSPVAEWVAAVGIAPLFGNRFELSVARLPSLIGIFAPELGAVLRADRNTEFYAAWDAPFSFLLDHDVAFDVTPRIMLVDSWAPPDPDDEDDDEPNSEVIFSLSLGLRLP